jgi:hypothetical protein
MVSWLYELFCDRSNQCEQQCVKFILQANGCFQNHASMARSINRINERDLCGILNYKSAALLTASPGYGGKEAFTRSRLCLTKGHTVSGPLMSAAPDSKLRFYKVSCSYGKVYKYNSQMGCYISTKISKQIKGTAQVNSWLVVAEHSVETKHSIKRGSTISTSIRQTWDWVKPSFSFPPPNPPLNNLHPAIIEFPSCLYERKRALFPIHIEKERKKERGGGKKMFVISCPKYGFAEMFIIIIIYFIFH